MLLKQPLVEVIPGTPAEPGQEASSTCYPKAPPNPDAPEPDPPPDDSGDPPPGGIEPPAGAPILLEHKDGAGGYTTEQSIAPPPSGYVCERRTIWVTVPGSTTPAAMYLVVCTEQ